MNVELIIRADSMSEIAHLFAPHGGQSELPAFDQRVPDKVVTHEPEARAKEVEPEEERPTQPRKSRAKKNTPTADTATETGGSTASPTSDPATVEKTNGNESPSDEPVTFEDLRAKASALMDGGKVDGRAIQDMLITKFDGARAFGALAAEQYPQAMAELENLEAEAA